MIRKLPVFAFILLLSCSSSRPLVQYSPADKQLLKDVEILSSDSYEGRKTGTQGADMARKYLIGRMKSVGLKSFSANGAYEQTFEINRKNNPGLIGKNLLGYLPGKTQQVIVVSAHYDHLGMIDNTVFNGADDNASGVAGILHIAKYFAKHKPNNTLVFAFFDAEEIGLLGAKAFVAHPPVALEKIRLNVNLDMISHNDKQELYVAGTFKYPELKPFLITSNPRIKLLLGHDDPKLGADDWTDQSDQGAFNAQNIPFIYFGVEDHKDYHKETDEFKNINKTFLIDVAHAIREVIVNIDQERDIQSIFREKLLIKKQ